MRTHPCSFLALALLGLGFAAQAANNPSPVDSLLTEDMIASLRDPFQAPLVAIQNERQKTELEAFSLKDLKLNGVITGPKKTRAMVTAPNGKSFFVGSGEPIGQRDGHVASINPDAIRIVEYEMNSSGKKIPETFEMRLSGETVSLTKKREEE